MTRAEIQTQLRKLRRLYEEDARARAMLRRCKDAGDVLLEGSFWRLIEDASVPDDLSRQSLAEVVAIFRAAEHREEADFRLGRYLADLLDPKRSGDPARTAPFRQLTHGEERGAVCARLARLFRFAGAPVDWGVVGADVILLSDVVRRRWNEDFYTRRRS